MFEYEKGTVFSIRLISEDKNVYEYLIETPDKNICKYFLRGNPLDVGQIVRMSFNEEENKYEILGAL